MPYTVELTSAARRDFAALEAALRRRVAASLKTLEHQPRPPGSLKLQDEQGAYRLRIGSYRLKYHVDDSARRVSVVKIEHRREVYR